MLYEDYLERLIKRLADEENIEQSGQEIFAEVAEAYQIGKLEVSLELPPTFYTKEGENGTAVLYQAQGQIKSAADYVLQHTTGEKGLVQLMVYRLEGLPAFTAEEERGLHTILEALYMNLGRWRLIRKIKRLSMTDALTGLVNAGGFLTYIDELLQKKQLGRYNAYYMNLERFSLVNKRFGVRETDLIIARYAKAMQGTMLPDECLGRLGGDNFVALVRKERTEEFIERIKGMTVYGMLGNQEMPVLVSAKAGVLQLDDHVTNCGNVLSDCSIALHVARHIAKQQIVFATDEIREQAYKEKQIENRFAEALQGREFQVYYQPKVSLDKYELVGAEALVRWQSGERMIPPAAFIPVYEQNGMVCELNMYVLDQVCRDMAEWREKGIEPVRVSVNISRKNLSNPRLTENILAILDKYQIEHSWIEIELTETMDVEESAMLIEFAEHLKAGGVAISIDDFGTGYSSLNLLKTFPADVLKLDKSFVDQLEETDKIVLSNIIRMASELKLDVVAEGVETKQQMEYLKSIHCDVVQGYLFDRPIPKDIYEERLKKKIYEPPQ